MKYPPRVRRLVLLTLSLLSALAVPATAQTHGDDDGSEVVDPHGELDAGPAASASAHLAPSVPRVRVQQKDGMLLIPGGTFTMGSADPRAAPNEKPPHAETVAAFWLDRTEVPVSAYRTCVDAHKCAPPQRSSALCTWDMGDGMLPVSCVRFQDADGYCRHAGKRLPREVEWEFAARGTHPIRYPWGGPISSCGFAATLVHDATARSCTGRGPAHVGAYAAGASPFGVLDLTGNVEEWTSDWYVEHVARGAQPHSGSSHVLRGGGWLSPPGLSKTTSRNWGSAVEAGANVGFRCAKDP